jgi:hypothetical protein
MLGEGRRRLERNKHCQIGIQPCRGNGRHRSACSIREECNDIGGPSAGGKMRCAGAVPLKVVCFSTGRGHYLPLILQPPYASNVPPGDGLRSGAAAPGSMRRKGPNSSRLRSCIIDGEVGGVRRAAAVLFWRLAYWQQPLPSTLLASRCAQDPSAPVFGFRISIRWRNEGPRRHIAGSRRLWT